ncbi:MAG: nucleotidyltransferase family protein [Rhodospirillales bacterium]|nr:nucleotidyltransferase family protein [Rhodospirillales bacterium]
MNASESPSQAPKRGMVLAAGLGLRMRPITLATPKPLIEIGGRSMLDRALDALAAADVARVVVNVHYLASAIEAHLADRPVPETVVSHEQSRLETGGGVAKALPLLGSEPFYVVNGDVLWRDGATPSLRQLASAWDAEAMDALLLLHPTATARGYDGPGDFFCETSGRLRRRGDQPSAPVLFAGLQILHPRLFDGVGEDSFSLNVLYDRAIAAGRLFGVIHQGGWCHVGTPADIPLAEAFLLDDPIDDPPVIASQPPSPAS